MAAYLLAHRPGWCKIFSALATTAKHNAGLER
jgi:hypothetical protein